MDKYIGIVISVDSAIAEVAMYDMVNDANILWEGQVLPGPKVGSFISILQGNVRIIAKVISEKLLTSKILLVARNLITGILRILLIGLSRLRVLVL